VDVSITVPLHARQMTLKTRFIRLGYAKKVPIAAIQQALQHTALLL
jgi:hypothetical protein